MVFFSSKSRCRLQMRFCVVGIWSACCIFISSNVLMKCRNTSTITHTEEQVYADVRGFFTHKCLLCTLLDPIVLRTSGPKVVLDPVVSNISYIFSVNSPAHVRGLHELNRSWNLMERLAVSLSNSVSASLCLQNCVQLDFKFVN